MVSNPPFTIKSMQTGVSAGVIVTEGVWGAVELGVADGVMVAVGACGPVGVRVGAGVVVGVSVAVRVGNAVDVRVGVGTYTVTGATFVAGGIVALLAVTETSSL